MNGIGAYAYGTAHPGTVASATLRLTSRMLGRPRLRARVREAQLSREVARHVAGDPDLPPLWSSPAPIGHNGGPAFSPRAPGRPSISTPELRDRICELLCDGVPLAVICRTSGMPSRSTVQRWRRDDPAFDRSCVWSQEQGYDLLAHRVVEEVEVAMKTRGVAMARLIFNLRRQQLARQAPGYFANRGMGR